METIKTNYLVNKCSCGKTIVLNKYIFDDWLIEEGSKEIEKFNFEDKTRNLGYCLCGRIYENIKEE